MICFIKLSPLKFVHKQRLYKKETLWVTEKMGRLKHHNGYWWTPVLSKHLSYASDFGLSLDCLLTTGWTVLEKQSISDTLGWKWWVIGFRDYLGLSNPCSYDINDVIGRADRFGFQNFCSPGMNVILLENVSLTSK